MRIQRRQHDSSVAKCSQGSAARSDTSQRWRALLPAARTLAFSMAWCMSVAHAVQPLLSRSFAVMEPSSSRPMIDSAALMASWSKSRAPHPRRMQRCEMQSLRTSIVDAEKGIERRTLGMFDKMHHLLHDDHPEWRHSLGRLLESHWFMGAILTFVVVDMIITLYVILAEHTDILNPCHEEQHEEAIKHSKRVAIAILVSFVLEQVGHLLAFGWNFFRKPWWVLDLLVVSVSLFLEISEKRIARQRRSGKELSNRLVAIGRLIGFMRLWKFAAFGFDLLYVGMLNHAMEEQAHHATVRYVRALESELIRRRIRLPHSDGPIV